MNPRRGVVLVAGFPLITATWVAGVGALRSAAFSGVYPAQI